MSSSMMRRMRFFSAGLKRHVLTLYLMKELFLYFTIAFLFFFLIFFVNQILLMARDILEKRVPMPDVLRLITYSLPFIIAQSAPFATLVGFLMCLGRLVTENEILIMRASGQSFSVVLVPVILTSIIISLLSFFVNDYLLPLGTIKYTRLRNEVLISNPAIEFESNSIKRSGNTTLVIGTVEDTEISDLLFFDRDSEGRERIIVSGPTHVMQPQHPGVLMQLEMTNAAVFFLERGAGNGYRLLLAQSGLMNIFTDSFFPSNFGTQPNQLTSLDLRREIQKMRADPAHNSWQLNLYELEYYKKFSLPFGSLFFAILAMPVAVIFGKHNGQTIGLIIGLFVSVLYWTMMILGQTFAIRGGLNGFWTMWAPDLLVGAAGLVFFFRLLRQ